MEYLTGIISSLTLLVTIIGWFVVSNNQRKITGLQISAEKEGYVNQLKINRAIASLEELMGWIGEGQKLATRIRAIYVTDQSIFKNLEKMKNNSDESSNIEKNKSDSRCSQKNPSIEIQLREKFIIWTLDYNFYERMSAPFWDQGGSLAVLLTEYFNIANDVTYSSLDLDSGTNLIGDFGRAFSNLMQRVEILVSLNLGRTKDAQGHI